MKLLKKRNCFEFIFFKNSIFVFFESLIPLFSVLPVNKKSAFLFDLLFNFLNQVVLLVIEKALFLK